MRVLLLVPILIVASLLIPPTLGAGEGEFVSDSPVALRGTGTVSGSPVVHHYAVADASLTGVAYGGTLVDHRTLQVPEGEEPVCDQFDGDVDEAPLVFVNVTRPDDRAEFSVLERSLALLRITSDLRFTFPSTNGNPGPAMQPFAHVGPNPYKYQTLQAPPEGDIDPSLAPVLPTTDFLVLPEGRFYTDAPGTLEVHWGALRVAQSGQSKTYEAGERRETRAGQSEILPNVPGQPYECRVVAFHVLRFQLDLATVAVDQAGLERTRAYYEGRSGMGNPFSDSDLIPPRGYWALNSRESFPVALDAYRLPLTFISASALAMDVQGSAVLSDAVGSILVRSRIYEAQDEEVTLTGRMTIQPDGADDEGRRMKTRISGDVTSFNGNADREPAAWVPYAWGGLGGVALLGGAFYTWPALKFGTTKLLLFPLYARLRKEDILENPLRDDILEVVNTEPGISASELGRRLTCGWGTLVYHLTVLEKMQLISSAREGRHKRFFVQGRINYSDKGAVGLLANAAARNILLAVQDHPGTIQRDLAATLGLTAGTVAWHVERLAAAGLVIKEEDGRVVRYYPSTKLMELTKQLGA